METSDSLIDPEAEVKKLQDLVKKLEQQNELLRTKQKLQLDSLQNGDTDRTEKLIKNVNNNLADSFVENKPKGQRIPSTCSQDDQDIIDLDSLSLKDEEDSWLYSSPKKPPTPMQTKVSPYAWVRQDFDRPSPEVISARKTLAYKLEEMARGIGRSPSTPAFSLNRSYPETKGNRMSISAPVPVTHSTPQSLGRSSHMGYSGSRVDTNTFTRPKKNRENGEERRIPRARLPEPREDIPNVSDIQNLAKLQEESLRQSLNSPLGSPRKVFKARHLPQMAAAVGSNESADRSPHTSNRSSPGRYEDPSHGRRPSNSMMSSGSQDSGSSPPDSPYSSQYLQAHQVQGERTESTRRSLPNLSKSNGMPYKLHRSDPSIDDGSVEDEEVSREIGRANPSPTGRASSPHMSGLKKPMMVRRTMSPQRSGLPTPSGIPRTGIPRPASAQGGRSSLPTPSRRSGIPSPRTVGRTYTPVDNMTDSDESWKEGCF